MKTISVIFFLTVLFTSCGKSKQIAIKNSLKEKLKGAWICKEIQYGEKLEKRVIKLSFDNENLTISSNNKTIIALYTINDALTPNQIDIKYIDGGEDFFILGIIKVQKNQLTLCLSNTDMLDRPANFKAEKGHCDCPKSSLAIYSKYDDKNITKSLQ